MTKEQFEIADEYLKILTANGGTSDKNEYYLKLGTDDVNVKDLNYVFGMLLIYNLINFTDDKKFNITLTPKGEEAFKMGLSTYFKSKRQEHTATFQEKNNK